MQWSTVGDELPILGDRLEKIATFLEGQPNDFTPILRHHPPSARPQQVSAACTQVNNIKRYWDDIRAIETQVLAIKKQIRARYASQWSLLSPISALPEEVLRHIFEYVWLDQTWKGTLALEGVCKRWHGIIVQHRILWSILTIPASGRLEKLVKPLERSHPLPVDLEISSTADRYRRQPEAHTTAGQMLCKRLQTLTLTTSESYVGVLQTVSSWDMPKLEQLESIEVTLEAECSTCGTSDYEHGRSVSLTAVCHLPRLATLLLEKACIQPYQPSDGNFNALTFLRLWRCTMTGHTVEAIIRSAPQLETLSICDYTSNHATKIFGTEIDSPFTHERLQTLMLDDVPVEIICGALFRHRYPNLLSLSVHSSSLCDAERHPDSADLWLPPARPSAYPLERSLYHTVCSTVL